MKHLYLIFIFLFVISGSCLAGVYSDVNRGNSRYRKADYKGAQEKYESALKKKPDSEIINFDCGTAAYKQGDYKAAQEYFARALVGQEKSLAEKAVYNLANSDFKYGLSLEESDLNQAVNQVENAIKHYAAAQKLDVKDKDAGYNYDVAQKELKRLKEKQKQQQQQQKKDQQQNKDQQQQNKDQQQNQAQPQDEQSSDQQKEQKPKQQNGQQDQQQQQSGRPSDESEGAQPAGEKDDLSKKEALQLLDSYRDNEEPKELYKEKQEMREVSEADKDW